MKKFKLISNKILNKLIQVSYHRHTQRYLLLVSFFESSFFPIPTFLILAPVVVAHKNKAWRIASLTTVMSVMGGIFGYLIGYFLYDQIGEPIIQFYHATEKIDTMKLWFDEYGVWLILLAGLTPIPYKIITISSGAMEIGLIPFIIASLIGRAAQFFLVTALVISLRKKN